MFGLGASRNQNWLSKVALGTISGSAPDWMRTSKSMENVPSQTSRVGRRTGDVRWIEVLTHSHELEAIAPMPQVFTERPVRP